MNDDTKAALVSQFELRTTASCSPIFTRSMSSEVRAAHLLIKHEGSRNPVSRRTGQSVTLSYNQALSELKEYEAKIQLEAPGNDLGTIFSHCAKQRSDCSSFKSGGELGFFGHGQMQRPFEEASFALQPNQMSGIVSTDSGLHLIFRIA